MGLEERGRLDLFDALQGACCAQKFVVVLKGFAVFAEYLFEFFALGLRIDAIQFLVDQLHISFVNHLDSSIIL